MDGTTPVNHFIQPLITVLTPWPSDRRASYWSKQGNVVSCIGQSSSQSFYNIPKKRPYVHLQDAVDMAPCETKHADECTRPDGSWEGWPFATGVNERS